MVGLTIGSYTLTGKIGEGGMGEVYRGRDNKLGRDVALKILPAAFQQDADRLARFEREARTLATLNHPNIAQIYGFEQSDGTSALVMELVEGEDLSERLQRGAVPVDEALAIARQVVSALEAAHEVGIVHRDLKPANIKIGKNGTVKVLDFGLAKAIETPTSGMTATAAITSPAMTEAGIILGTAAYMSPEQARGQQVDRRADIWAFGVVLLEMLTGTRAFAGDTVSDVIAAVLRSEPDFSQLPRTLHPRIAELIRRCLRKDVRRRLRDLGDAGVELDDVIAGTSEPAAAVSAPQPRSRSVVVAWTVALLSVIAALAAIRLSPRPSAVEPRTVARVSVVLPDNTTLFLGRGSSVAISPDGTRIVYTATENARTQLYERALDQTKSVALPGTDGASDPVFSTDGQWVPFSADRQLKKVNLQGRTVTDVIRAPNPRGANWAPDGSVIFTPDNGSGLSRVPASGGPPQELTALGNGELSHRWPQVSRDGRVLVYTIWNDTGFEGGRIAVQKLDGGEKKILVQGGGYGRLVETGNGRNYLVYAQADGLLAAPMDLDRLELTGPVTPVNESVAANLSGGAHFAFSNSGHLVYSPGTIAEAAKTLLWVDRTGKETVAAEIPDLSVLKALASDGRTLIRLNTQGPSRDVYVHNLDTGESRRLTNGGLHGRPVVTQDNKRVIYQTGLPNSNLFWKPLDGGGEEQRLTTSSNEQFPSSTAPDNKSLVYSEFDPVTGSDIWRLSLEPPYATRELVRTKFSEGNAAISPDGK